MSRSGGSARRRGSLRLRLVQNNTKRGTVVPQLRGRTHVRRCLFALVQLPFAVLASAKAEKGVPPASVLDLDPGEFFVEVLFWGIIAAAVRLELHIFLFLAKFLVLAHVDAPADDDEDDDADHAGDDGDDARVEAAGVVIELLGLRGSHGRVRAVAVDVGGLSGFDAVGDGRGQGQGV